MNVSRKLDAPALPGAAAGKPPAGSSLPWGRSLKALAPVLVWLVVMLVPTPAGLQPNQWHYFGIFAAVIAGLVFESMPVGAMGLVGLTFAALMGYAEPDPTKAVRWALSGFSESTVWLIVGAYVFAVGYRKSGLGERVALLLVRLLGRKTLGLGYAVAFSDFLLGPATPSNTARSAGTVFPIVSNIPRIYGSEPNSPTAGRIGNYVMWTAFASTAITSSLFFTALAPNAAAMAIAKKIVGVDTNWSQWFVGFLPAGLLLILLVPLVGYVLCRPTVKESPEIVAWAAAELERKGPLSSREWKMLGMVLLAMFLWITGSNKNISVPLLGSNFINATMVVLLGVSLLLMLKVVEFNDILAERGAWEVFFFLSSLLTLASGLNDIGFVKWFAETVASPLHGMSPTVALILLVGLFFWIHYFFSSLTSHTAAVLPVVLAVGAGIPGLNVPVLAMLCVYSLGLMGVISPYATGPAPIYFGSGYIGKGAFWKYGLIFGLMFFAALIFIVMPWLEFLAK